MLFEQAMRLITQPPDSLAFHIIVLLTLQVAFAVALWQWRHDAAAGGVWRLWTAAGSILVLRLGLAAVQFSLPLESSIALLPPMERALDLATTLLVIWGIVPVPRLAPRLWDSFLIIAFIGIILASVFAVQNWLLAVEQSPAAVYRSSDQAVIWAGAQLVLLAAAVLWIFFRRPFDWVLRFLLLATLMAAHLLHALDFLPPDVRVENLPDAVNLGLIPFWARLAYLVAFPMLAAVAYRQNLAGLLGRVADDSTIGQAVARVLRLSSSVAVVEESEMQAREAAGMAQKLLAAHFAAVALPLERGVGEDPFDGLRLVSAPDTPEQPAIPTWLLRLGDWPGMQMALRRSEIVELSPAGMGARQLADLKNEINLRTVGPLLIVPLVQDKRPYGLLLLGGKPGQPHWPAESRQLAEPVAAHIASLFALSQSVQEAPAASSFNPAALPLAGQARLDEEMEALRESLRSAEEALALASAGEGGLSTEWVTRALTHYSSELEDAQRQIALLEDQLGRVVYGPARDSMTILSEEMRSPVTAIQGYVGVMLAESNGSMPFEHRHLLERIEASTGRIDELIGRLDERMGQLTHMLEDAPRANLLEIYELVVDSLQDELQARRLTLDLNLPGSLPRLQVEPHDLYQLLNELLRQLLDCVPEKERLVVEAGLMANSMTSQFVRFQIQVPGQEAARRWRTVTAAGSNEPQKQSRPPASAPGEGSDWYDRIRRYNGRVWVSDETAGTSSLILVFPAEAPIAV